MDPSEERIRNNLKKSAYITTAAFLIGGVLMLLANSLMYSIWFIIISILFFVGAIVSYFLINRLEKVFLKKEENKDV